MRLRHSTGPVYKVGGRLLGSNVELRELELVANPEAEIHFELLSPIEAHAEPDRWFHGWPVPQGEDRWWMRAAEVSGEYLLRFPGFLDVRVSADGRDIRGQPLGSTPLETVRHLLLDQVLPLALGLAGAFVLHANAVSFGEEAFAVVGASGMGKSTLAASFASSGFPILTDDCLVLERSGEGWSAVPFYPAVRLWPANLEALFPAAGNVPAVAHYSTKRRLDVPGVPPFSSESMPLRSLFFLTAADERTPPRSVSIEPMPPRAAFLALVQANFLLEIRAREVLERQFTTVGQLTDEVPCFTLDYPREYGALPEVRAAILARVRSCPVRGGGTG